MISSSHRLNKIVEDSSAGILIYVPEFSLEMDSIFCKQIYFSHDIYSLVIHNNADNGQAIHRF